MWPPVFCTLSTVNSRISRQSSSNSSRWSSRRSRGCCMRSRMVIIAILAAMFDLSKRAVILTGATGNIGPTVLRAYLEHGAHVAIPVRDEAKGAALRDSLGDLAGTAEDPRVLVRATALGERAAIEGFVEQMLRAWGRLDIVANLIGGYTGSGAARGAPAGYRRHRGQKGPAILAATNARL